MRSLFVVRCSFFVFLVTVIATITILAVAVKKAQARHSADFRFADESGTVMGEKKSAASMMPLPLRALGESSALDKEAPLNASAPKKYTQCVRASEVYYMHPGRLDASRAAPPLPKRPSAAAALKKSTAAAPVPEKVGAEGRASTSASISIDAAEAECDIEERIRAVLVERGTLHFSRANPFHHFTCTP